MQSGGQNIHQEQQQSTPPPPSTFSPATLLLVLLALASAYYFSLPQPAAKPNIITTPSTDDKKMSSAIRSTAASTLTQISRRVIKSVEAIEQGEGAGARVRRSIGTQQIRNLTPFLMLDHFTIGEGAGFPDHPHRGQSTWTYMLEGTVQHEDSKGAKGDISVGDLQAMVAGSGIIHAEMPKHYDENGKRLPDPVGLQLWVDLPSAAKKLPAQYQEMKGSDLPLATPRADQPVETEGQGWAIKVIAGLSHGVESPVKSPENGGTWYLDVRLSQPGAKVFQEIPKGWTSFIYTLGPSPVKIGDLTTLGKAHQRYHTLVLDAEGESNGVWLEHCGKEGEGEARLMIYAAQPLDQEVYQYGPFVLDSREGVNQAMMDYRRGVNGFEGSGTWKSKIGGL